MSPRRLLAIAIVTLLVAAGVVCSSKSFRTYYHAHVLEQIHIEIDAVPTSLSPEGFVGYGNLELFERRDWHRDRLVELGYFFHKRYEIQRLDSDGKARKRFWELLQREFPEDRYTTMGSDDNILEVWDRADAQPDWDVFVERYHKSLQSD